MQCREYITELPAPSSKKQIRASCWGRSIQEMEEPVLVKHSKRKDKDLVMSENSYPTELFDTELQCLRCGLSLCVPSDQLPALLDLLERTRQAILLCACGHAQIVGYKHTKRND